MTINKKSITISKELQEKLIILAKDSGFENLEVFLNYILHEIVSSAYSGMEKDLVDDKNAEIRLIDLIKKNPDAKEYYVALYSHYVDNGNLSKAGDIQVKILNRFY